MELDTNNHSEFLLYYHLVLVTKYRRQVIDNEISNYAKATFEKISESYHITLVEWNHDKDHVRIMFKAQPKTELPKFINAYKNIDKTWFSKSQIVSLERNVHQSS